MAVSIRYTCEITTSQIQTKECVRQSLNVVDRGKVCEDTRNDNDARRASRSVQGQVSLDRQVHGGHGHLRWW